MYMNVRTFKKNSAHNFVRPRWVELYLTPGNWSGLFRTGFFQGGSTVWPLAFVLSPGSWQSVLKCESSPLRILSLLCCTGSVFYNILYYKWLPTCSNPSLSWNDVSIPLEHHENLSFERYNMLVGLRKKGYGLCSGCWWNRVISGSSPSSENSDVICIHCQNCSFMILDV